MELRLVKYSKHKIDRPYEMTEIPAHFGVVKIIAPEKPYSLHTEYSAWDRPRSSDIKKNYTNLNLSVNNVPNGIPRLWVNDDWAYEFAKWLGSIIPYDTPPSVIEIHPPFEKDCDSISFFLNRVDIFAKKIHEMYKDTQIVIENRTGSKTPPIFNFDSIRMRRFF